MIRSHGCSRAPSCETGLFSAVDAPPGPVIERYAGAPWPGGRFG